MAYRLAAGETVGGRVALAGPTDDYSSAWRQVFLFGREAARLSRTHTCAVRGSVLPLNWRLFEGRGLSREVANIRTALLAPLAP